MLGSTDSALVRSAVGPIKEPAEVADRVVDAVYSERFLILTDPIGSAISLATDKSRTEFQSDCAENTRQIRRSHGTESRGIRSFDRGDLRRSNDRCDRQQCALQILHRYVAGPTAILRTRDHRDPQQSMPFLDAAGGYDQSRSMCPCRTIGVRKGNLYDVTLLKACHKIWCRRPNPIRRMFGTDRRLRPAQPS